jgi:tetratricopeptide (TPR) repeat protein
MEATKRGNRYRLATAALLAALALTSWVGGVENPPVTPAQARADERIARLIEQLGAEDFGLRERAQGELGQLGLEAYDALHAALSHHDPEIALRARYLVRSMSVRWFAESDSPKVVAILKEYGDLPEEQRRNRIDRLATLEQRLGVSPLVRLARFETMEPLAKYAALKILELPPPTEKSEQEELNRAIAAVAGNSRRTASGWLRLHAQTLADPAAALPAWNDATQAEHELFRKNPEKSSKEIVRDLYRAHVEWLNRLDRPEEAIAVIRRTFALLDGTPEQLQEIVDWLMNRQAWPAALEVLQQFDATVQEHALLLYRLAAVHDRLNQPEPAEQMAARALALKVENLDEHIRIGHMLEETLGLPRWAEAEYRQVVTAATAGSLTDFRARFRLSELLHDRLQELSAAEILKPVCDLMQQDATARDTCARAERDPDSVMARMHYLFACHFHEQGDTVQERQRLQAASEADATDADVLIAMYRLPGADKEWLRHSKKLIDSAVAEFQSQVTVCRANVESADDEQSRQFAAYRLGIACNQYAWLVGNTYGDFVQAVQFSEESVRLSQEHVELKPNYPGFLDTLGRCCYAAGDLARAVKHQSLAAELNPHSGQIRRQLEGFVREAHAKGVALPGSEPASRTPPTKPPQPVVPAATRPNPTTLPAIPSIPKSPAEPRSP